MPSLPLSETARRALYARDGGGEVFLDLIRIHHASWPLGVMRFVNNTSNITSRGAVYEAAPFEMPLPAQVEAGSPNLTIILQNVDRLIEAELAALTSEPTIVYDCVRASAPDDLVFTYRFPMRSSVTTKHTIQGTLGGVEPILSKSFPRSRFNSIEFPGLATDGSATSGGNGDPDPDAISLSASPLSTGAGADVVVTFANAPGTVNDWIGRYVSTETDQTAHVARRYLNGTPATPPATPILNGSVTFPMNGPLGAYNFRLFENDGFVVKATSQTVNVLGPSISATPTTIASGGIVTVTVANGPGNTTDWVGFYTEDTHTLLIKKYLNGSATTPPTTALTGAILTFTMPTAVGGNIEGRFFFYANDTTTNPLDTSELITVVQ